MAISITTKYQIKIHNDIFDITPTQLEQLKQDLSIVFEDESIKKLMDRQKKILEIIVFFELDIEGNKYQYNYQQIKPLYRKLLSLGLYPPSNYKIKSDKKKFSSTTVDKVYEHIKTLEKPISITQLSIAVGISESTLYPLSKQLENKRLITRRRIGRKLHICKKEIYVPKIKDNEHSVIVLKPDSEELLNTLKSDKLKRIQQMREH